MFKPISAAARIVSCVALVAVANLTADAPRALPPGHLPNDVRLRPLKDLDGYFPFTPPESREAWAKRAERVRRQILVAEGLWPMPTRTDLNPVIYGRIDRGDYTVEKAYFESAPGFFVTGNLYRPKGKNGKVPGVLCPHGHWNNGRFMDAGLDDVRRDIVQGAERFEEGGRSPLQARCVTLARMGCVVFHYDMIGYADSVQIPQSLAHGFSKQRPEMNSPENWGLFSPQAEEHLQSVMGLQTWDSIRALDFLLSLPDVDPERIAVTGASGGGTQTFILSAIDPRVKVAFPAVMVSTAMQGGCTCENACDLRIDTGNVEFAALFAPKPLGMTCANDWTVEMSTKGFPQLKELFTLLGAPDNVMLKRAEQFGHNYNYVSRAAMYSWMNRQLKLGLPEPVVEQDYQRLTRDEMSVWEAQHPKPEGGPDFERQLLRMWHDDAQDQLLGASMNPERFRAMVEPALEVVLGRNLATAGEPVLITAAKTQRDGWVEKVGVLRNASYMEEIPVVLLQPAGGGAGAVLWLSPEGKAGLFGSDGAPRPEIRQLLAAGKTVVGVDLFLQGEFLPDGQPVTKTRRVKNPREAAAYTFGYNYSLFAQRVQDVLTALAWLRSPEVVAKHVALVGLAGAGHWAAAARAVAAPAIDASVIDTGGFRFGGVNDLQSPDFLPGGAKYLDLPGMLAVASPARRLLLADRPEDQELVEAAFRASPEPATLTPLAGDPAERAVKAVAWLLERN